MATAPLQHRARTASPDAGEMLGWMPRLHRYARALHRNREDADDLVQDTLERAWTRAALWQGVGDMRGWLFSIMHNLHVDALRRGHLDLVDIEQPPDIPVAATQAERLALRDLDAALALLPVEQRQVLLLVALEGMAYAEIAEALGIPIGTVMSRVSRGRERLRSLMGGAPSLSGGGWNSRPAAPSTPPGPRPLP